MRGCRAGALTRRLMGGKHGFVVFEGGNRIPRRGAGLHREEPHRGRQARSAPDAVGADRKGGVRYLAPALYKRGWVAPYWPKEHGGAGWTPAQRYIFESECSRAGAPRLLPFGVQMVGPVIMKFGSQVQKDFYLPRILSGEDYWCQGYSEPGSGSDLASLKTRAVRDGENYVVNGTKIWTTHAALRRPHVRAGAHVGYAEATGRHQFPFDRHEDAGHFDPADPDHRRRPRGQPGVLRRRARAGREPRRRGEQGLDLRQISAGVRARRRFSRRPDCAVR